jgi:hypothetical protein
MRRKVNHLLLTLGRRVPIKQIATVTLMLGLGVAGIYAQPGNVSAEVSGSAARSTISLQGTPASEYQLAGTGSLGQFTLRVLSTSLAAPQRSTTCSGPTKVYFPTVAGAGILRSQDGSLLKVSLTGGGDCIDFAVGGAVCTRVLQVTSGTGRFTNSSGTVTLTMTVVPVLADGPTSPVFFSVTGDLTGSVAGAASNQGSQNGQP